MSSSGQGAPDVEAEFERVAEELRKASQAQLEALRARLEEIREKYKRALAEIRG